jgi:hypothetical protein
MMRFVLALVNRLLIRFFSVGRGSFTWLLLKTDETLEVGYWKIRGLGAPLRMMCEYVGAAYEPLSFEAIEKPDGSFNLDSWFKERKPDLLKLNALTNLPVRSRPIIFASCFSKTRAANSRVHLCVPLSFPLGVGRFLPPSTSAWATRSSRSPTRASRSSGAGLGCSAALRTRSPRTSSASAR